jgi:hypothetical protein
MAEKHEDIIAPAMSSSESVNVEKGQYDDDNEVFKRGEGIEDFRTVGWIPTAVIFLKRK